MRSNSPSITHWRLQAGADRRFRSGHPWVYSNELQGSPKGVAPGEPIELSDAGGAFLARGFGNPGSLIAFRAVSRVESETDALEPAGLARALAAAWRLRERAGLGEGSFRWVFGEADGLPGLVIDRYVGLASDGKPAQAVVAQPHSAGAERFARFLPEVLAQVLGELGQDWARTEFVIRRDLPARKLEGLPEIAAEAQVERAHAVALVDARAFPARIGALTYELDLLGGQKTGFFLDQRANVDLAIQRLVPGLRARAERGEPLRVVDLFAHLGQWGASFAQALRRAFPQAVIEVTVADASAPALERAAAHVTAVGATRVRRVKADLMAGAGEGFPDLAVGEFDIVVCDPPALIKGRKNIPVGRHAYGSLNTAAMGLVAPGGAIVTCSCSALLAEDDFVQILAKSDARARKRAGQAANAGFRWIARGGQAPDHPVLAEFPEGRYLKCWIGAKNS